MLNSSVTKRFYNFEDRTIHRHRCKSLKYKIFLNVFQNKKVILARSRGGT
jgi:hypothetical protein